MAGVFLDGQPAPGPQVLLERPWSATLELRWGEGAQAPTHVELDGSPVPRRHSQERPRALSLPTLSGELTWRDEGALQRARLVAPEGSLPGAAETELLLRLRQELVARAEGGGLTLTDLERVPMAPLGAMLDALEPTPLDEALEARGVGALLRVARRPRSWLRREESLVPIERLRRMSRRAERHLERQSDVFFDGCRVMPARLLASFREEELDLYENRVAASLARRLQERAARRLARLEAALSRLRQLNDSIHRAYQLGQFRRHGLLRKELDDARADHLDALLDDAEAQRRRLKNQLRACAAFAQSPVGRALRRAPLTTWPPRDTNILTYDQDYETLARAWRLFEAERREDEAVDPWLADPNAGFADYCLLLLLRALRRCGYQPDHPTARVDLTPGEASGHASTWRFGGRWTLDVSRQKGDQTISVAVWDERRRAADRETGRWPQPRERLQLVPTFTTDTSARPDSLPDETSVWLHPVDALPDDYEGALRWLSFDEAPSPRGERRPYALPVAPWVFQAEDRLGRLIRRVTSWVELTEDPQVPRDCPTCGGAGRQVNRDDYECADPTCGTRWGRRTCGCGAVIPKVLPARPRQEAIDEQVLQHWEGGPRHALAVDIGGRDLLASPCLHFEGIGSDMLICPSCGDCGREDCGEVGDCPRCR